MTEQKKYIILIPDTCKHADLLCCPVDPPTDKMSITFCNPGEKEPFAKGQVSRRCPEIDAFFKRPQKLNLKTKARDTLLKHGDKVIVKVTIYAKQNEKTKELSEPIQELEQEVLVIDEKTKPKDT